MESESDHPECTTKTIAPSNSESEKSQGLHEEVSGFIAESIDHDYVNPITNHESKSKVVVKHVSFMDDNSKQFKTGKSSSGSPRSEKHEKSTPCDVASAMDLSQYRMPKPFSSKSVKTTQYGSHKPLFVTKFTQSLRSLFRKWMFSPEETQKRLHLLSDNSDEYDPTCDFDVIPVKYCSAESLKMVNRNKQAPSQKRITDQKKVEYGIPSNTILSHDKLSKENLLVFNKSSVSRHYEDGKNHSIACALVNIGGGSLLGFNLVGCSTALSVLYPCSFQMIPEHAHMWKISGLLSVVNIGAAAGSLIGGYGAEKYGRKISMIAGGIVALAPLMTMMVKGYILQFFSRIITGVSVGVTSSICGLYVSEMAPVHSRGFLNCFFEVSINGGILLANVVAYFVLGTHRDFEIDDYCRAMADHPCQQSAVSYQLIWYVMLSGVILAGLFLALVISPLVPESKVWLAKHARTVTESHPDRDSVFSTVPTTPINSNKAKISNDACIISSSFDGLPGGRVHKNFDEQSLTMISVGWAAAKSPSEDSIEERDAALGDFQFESACRQKSAEKRFPSSIPSHSIEEPIKPYDPHRYQKPSFWKKMSELKKPIAIAVVNAVALQLTGMYALMFYSHRFLEVGHIKRKMLGTLLIMSWNWVSTFISLSLVERIGRRRLLIPSMFVLTLTIISMPMAISYGKGATHGIFFLFLLLGIYLLAYEAGIGTLFWCVASEVFPHEFAQMGFAMVNCLQWILMVVVTFLFPPLQKILGGWVFAVFFLPSLFSTVFFYLVLPETKGKSRREVAREMQAPQWITGSKKFW